MIGCTPCDYATGPTKSKGLLFYRSSPEMTSPSDTILPPALADQLFRGNTFLPKAVFDRHLDHTNATKAPVPFATIRSYSST